MPRTMGSEYRHRVIRIDVTVMSHFTHLNMRFTGFLVLFMRRWFPTIISKRGCALYTKLRSIHHFKGLDKGCVLYTGASYTREITVCDYANNCSINRSALSVASNSSKSIEQKTYQTSTSVTYTIFFSILNVIMDIAPNHILIMLRTSHSYCKIRACFN